jgi:hypothetical protein
LCCPSVHRVDQPRKEIKENKKAKEICEREKEQQTQSALLSEEDLFTK